ncbi:MULTISPECIES: protein-disulfide reductase DsbD [unclassified Acinetobacter]|uniref:protein-disulfide reductase DsbD n=1 Tax=unclassified Acinetobacter TaxID=196816 RepID=UPI0015D26BBA|nr:MULTISPECIES: protein-disulfide reductase DsbD [unclassified Acinetobacter]UUS64517.1 protein-disulfide reductase DsbD [Acinetobacter sp. YH12068_T]
MRIGLVGLCGIFSILSVQSASADFLPPDQAFAFQAVSTAQDQASFTWRIADGYYLYHDQIKVIENGKALSLQLPRPQQKDDPNFGMTDVHYGQVQATVAMQPNQSYKIEWQGCAESGLCYPVQRTTIHTDADGLLPESKLSQQSTTQKKLLDAVTSTSLPNTAMPVDPQAKNTETVTVVTPANTAEVKADENGLSPSSEVTALTEPSEASTPELDDALMMQASSESVTTRNAEQRTKQADWNNDQYFFYLLSTDNIALNLIIFLGLGVLLAFLPCSLPLIPILSSILVQRHRGYRAGMIAGVFVVGMALIYALMGLAVAGLGYNFQRWLQSPIFIGLFAVMFVLFALNLFGIFQLSLPQGVLQRLDQWQQRQKGGTLWGSFIMGMISALIVGPCMSAPLAGALLFVAQLPEPWMGASYLFILGLGVGLPLLIACVFGAQYLPKPGVWMDRLKFTFGFVMLLLAVYFLRPLLPSVVYLTLMGLLLIGITIYILWKIRPHILQMPTQLLFIAMSLATAISGGWYVTQAWSQLSTTQATTLVAWQKVRTQAELEQALNQVKGQAVLIDVYADWCVACQPIEKEVLPRADVQIALDAVARIKLDLTEYEASQDIVLKDWQILGPPTMIFLDVQHQEQRNLRLTGTFSAAQLLSRLNRGTPP